MNQVVFVGSSLEGRQYAHSISTVLRQEWPSIDQRCWWHTDVFRAGEAFIESLERESQTATAAVFVFSPDDPAKVRERAERMPRDNVLFEYGMFVGLKGRRRVALVQVGDAKLPSDLAGITVVRVPKDSTEDTMRDIALAGLRGWVERLASNSADPMPTVTEILSGLRSKLEGWRPSEAHDFDRTASQLLRSTYESIRTDNRGVNTAFARLAEHEAKEAVSISAYDTTGPAGWMGPATYRYLAFQVREYLFANRLDGTFKLFVHDWLQSAVEHALEKAMYRPPYAESITPFDDAEAELPSAGIPKLQYSRVLVWTEEELSDPLAEPIINLHDAFRIPLFFVPVAEDAKEKELAFVVFEKRDGRSSALYGLRQFEYNTARDTESLNGGNIPGYGYALDLYKEILKRPDLMFASDARAGLDASRPHVQRHESLNARTHGA